MYEITNWDNNAKVVRFYPPNKITNYNKNGFWVGWRKITTVTAIPTQKHALFK